MTNREWEKLLGELLRRFRQAEVDPLRARLAIVEQQQAIAERLTRIEARIGVDSSDLTRDAELPPYSTWRGRQ